MFVYTNCSPNLYLNDFSTEKIPIPKRSVVKTTSQIKPKKKLTKKNIIFLESIGLKVLK